MCRSLVILLLISTVATAEKRTDPTSVLASSVSISNSVDALRRAELFLGTGYTRIPLSQSVASSPVVRRFTNDKTPFVRLYIDDRPVWVVEYSGIFFDLPSFARDLVESQTPKDFTILIDSSTGRFLKAYTTLGHFDPDLAPEPEADSAEKQADRIEGLPDQAPPIGLFQALDASVGVCPVIAKELIITCVKVRPSKFNESDSIVWMILARGVPNVIAIKDNPEREKRFPLYRRNRFIGAVGAITGNPLYTKTAPPVTRDPYLDRLWRERSGKP